MITGFRHALGGYQQICGVLPDLTTFGKAMGNGYPVGGVAGRRDLMEQFTGRRGRAAGRDLQRQPAVAAAAAMATIDYLRDHPEFYERTHALGGRVRAGLRDRRRPRRAATAAGFGGVFALYFADTPSAATATCCATTPPPTWRSTGT